MDDAKALNELMTQYEVATLGGLNTTIGFNMLASMACTLANLAPNDRCSITYPDKTPVRLGTSLLIMGGATSGYVVDEIVTEVCRLQDNLLHHLEHFIRGNQMPFPGKKSTDPLEPCEGDSHELILQTTGAAESGRHISNFKIPEVWHKILINDATSSSHQIIRQHKFLVSQMGQHNIDQQLAKVRTGNALVHVGLTHPDDIERFSDTGSALLEARYPLANGTRSLKANLLITDPMGVMASAAQKPDQRSLWLGQLVWLSDGDTGPSAPMPASDAPLYLPEHLERKFRESLIQMSIFRLCVYGRPIQLVENVRKLIPHWTHFLNSMEERLPGISCAARNLYTSLYFGLQCMAKDPAKLRAESVLALAQFLARRMAGTRTALLHTAELEQRRHLIKRIFHKLANGPADGRKLCRDLKISSAERDQVLCWLESAQLAHVNQKSWQLRQGAKLSFNSCSVPPIEV